MLASSNNTRFPYLNERLDTEIIIYIFFAKVVDFSQKAIVYREGIVILSLKSNENNSDETVLKK
jgi:hypothetical protein